ncbi:MAG: hypothetical protein ACRDRL_21235, partial [Sciscionella sp.]
LGAGAILGVLLAGRFADRLLARGRVSGRMLVAGSAFALTAVMIVPTAGLRPLALAAPLLFLVAAGLGGSNPPLDAARLDIMIAPLWGRAESVRTALRSLFVAAAPLLFGLVSVAFAGGGSPFNSTGGTGAAGLNLTFLVMAVSLVLAAVILLIPARKAYPADVATAAAAEHESAA